LRKARPGAQIFVRDLGAGPANLRRIGAALHEYHSVHGSFPPAVLLGPDGRTPYSWRVALLPYLGCQKLFERYRFDQAWDSPANRKVLNDMPDVYRGPHARPGTVESTYSVVTGPKTVFAGSHGVSMSEVRMLSLVVVETKPAVAWTKPADIPYDAAGPVPSFGGLHADGFNGLLVTGEVDFFGGPFHNDPERLRPYLSKTYDVDREAEITAALAGKPAPDFTLKDLSGADVTLSKLIAGKVALVSFSAVRCPACRLEAPHLTALHERLGSQGLVVVAVNPWNEDRNLVQSYVAKEKLTHLFLLQGKAVFDDQYRLFEAPTSCWIDHRGRIVSINFGFDADESNRMIERASKLLADRHKDAK
jgi:peroxiredoxin